MFRLFFLYGVEHRRKFLNLHKCTFKLKVMNILFCDEASNRRNITRTNISPIRLFHVYSQTNPNTNLTKIHFNDRQLADSTQQGRGRKRNIEKKLFSFKKVKSNFLNWSSSLSWRIINIIITFLHSIIASKDEEFVCMLISYSKCF